MTNTTKIAGSAVLGTAMLLSTAGLAFAQTSTTTGATSTSTGAPDTSIIATTTPITPVVPGTPTDAGTGASTVDTTGVITPGTPNTGAGGDAMANMLLLAASALGATLGATYLLRQRATR